MLLDILISPQTCDELFCFNKEKPDFIQAVAFRKRLKHYQKRGDIMANIIVTGATSMVGVAIIQEAIKNQEVGEILAVVRPNTKKTGRIPHDNKIEIIEAEFNDYERLSEYVNSRGKADFYDVFYHLAWSRTPTYKESYSDMLLKCDSIAGVLSAAKAAKDIGCKKFVYTGGQAEYGIIDADYIRPDTPCDPVRADGIAHLAAGKMAKILCGQFGIPFIWVRIFSVYGVNDRPDSMISVTVKKMMNHEPCQFTEAEQIWDYLNAQDLGEAILLSGLKVNEDKVYCVGSGDAKPLREYIETMRDVINPEMDLKFGEIPYPSNPVMRLCPDISDIVRDTGWKPHITFETGIREICENERNKDGE